MQKAKLTSNPADRAKLYSQAQEIFYQQAPWIALANGKTFYATRSNVTGYSVSLMGSDFSKSEVELIVCSRRCAYRAYKYNAV